MSKKSYITLFVKSGMYNIRFSTGIHMAKSCQIVFLIYMMIVLGLVINEQSFDEVQEDALEPVDE